MPPPKGNYGPPQDPQEMYPMKPMYNDNGPPPQTQQPYAIEQVVVQSVGPKPPNNLIISLVSMLCNPIFGAMAFLFSRMSDKAYKLGHTDLARRYGRFAMITAVIGICITAVIGIIAAIVNAAYLGGIGGYR